MPTVFIDFYLNVFRQGVLVIVLFCSDSFFCLSLHIFFAMFRPMYIPVFLSSFMHHVIQGLGDHDSPLLPVNLLLQVTFLPLSSFLSLFCLLSIQTNSLNRLLAVSPAFLAFNSFVSVKFSIPPFRI